MKELLEVSDELYCSSNCDPTCFTNGDRTSPDTSQATAGSGETAPE
jgi:hypothetical protein